MDTGIQGIKSMFRHPDLGLLIIRVAVGLIFLFAGYTKFTAGETTLNTIGANIKYLGLDVGTNNISTLFFGLLAAGSEAVGGLMLVIGYMFRTSSSFLFVTMIVATLSQMDSSVPELAEFGFPMIMGLVVAGLLFTGPGRFSLQKD